MGLQISYRPCDGCSSLCTRERLCPCCLGSHGSSIASAAATATIVAAHEEYSSRLGRPEREKYQVCADTGYIFGSCLNDRQSKGCPEIQQVCGPISLQRAAAAAAALTTTAAWPQVRADPSSPCPDEVMPVPVSPPSFSSDVPNIGERQPLSALEDTCRFNTGKVNKIRSLGCKGYSCWRSVRGDGNCYYRSVIFGAFEAALLARDFNQLRQFNAAFREVQYDDAEERRAHADMLRRLQRWDDLEQLEHWVGQDPGFDLALVRACRRLVRLFLIRNANEAAPNGMTYLELITALDSAYTNVEDFCNTMIDPMGRDAETLAVDALPLQLGIGVRLWVLDRRDEVDLISLDTPRPDGKVDVHVLFKPGHYDLLYLSSDEA